MIEDGTILSEEPFHCRLARLFHDTYESAAPMFGYETRTESAKPWGEVPEQNRALMEYVCSAIEAELIQHVTETMERMITGVKKAVRDETLPETLHTYAEQLPIVLSVPNLAQALREAAKEIRQLRYTVALHEQMATEPM